MSALEKCPQPVIVAMHYGVYGVAVDLCTAGDIRYGTKDSFYTVKVNKNIFICLSLGIIIIIIIIIFFLYIF